MSAKRITMTYTLAMAIARDAANARMRSEDRTRWNREDRNHAAEKFSRLYPLDVHMQALREGLIDPVTHELAGAS